MLMYMVICSVSLVVAALTLVCGFGLGTILTPAFAFFFPLDIAIAATAIVHLANNLFKLILVGRYVRLRVLWPFIAGAIPAAIAGAFLLQWLSTHQLAEPLMQYQAFGKTYSILMLNLVIGGLLMAFALIEFIPGFDQWAVHQRWVWVGGVLSGFFGGLSGNQGALRAAFLIRTGLTKEEFVGTSAAASVVVDCVRLAIYFSSFFLAKVALISDSKGLWLVVGASLAAFVGSYLGSLLIKKMTIKAVKIAVAVMVFALGGAMAAGLLGK